MNIFNGIDINKINVSKIAQHDDKYESMIIYENGKLNIKMKNMRLIRINNGKIMLEFTESTGELYKFIYQLDNYLKQFLYEHSKIIFGLQLNIINVTDLYKNSICIPEDLHNYPYIEVKYNSGGEINVDTIVDINVEISKIIFEKNKCYLEYIMNDIIINEEVNEYNINTDIERYIECE